MSEKITQNGHSAFYSYTLELLRNRPITLTLDRLSRETGLPEGWLLSILSKPHISPSVDRVVKLYEYLSNKPLAF